MSFPDFVVLRKVLGTPTSLNTERTYILDFEIPSSYYTNARGSVCNVSLIDFTLKGDTNPAGGIIVSDGGMIEFDLNCFNCFDTANERFKFACSLGRNLVINNSQQIKYLTKSNPSSVSFRLQYRGTALPTTEAIFVLKFEYFNIGETQEDFNNVLTKTF
jgi:hypothetical protein